MFRLQVAAPIILFLVPLWVGVAIGQEEKPPERIIELPELTKKIAEQKLSPIWDAHKCENLEIFYIINYGSRIEVRRRMELISDTIGLRCDIIGFRAVYLDGSQKSAKPLTVIWRVQPKGERPEP